MKKLLAALAAIAMVAALFATASASPRWYVQEVKWRTSRFASGTSTTPVRTDTAFAHVGPVGVADTTNWFKLQNLAALREGAQTDSIIYGYLIFASDTAATYTASLTALTVAIDATAPAALINAPTNSSFPSTLISDQAVTNTVSLGSSFLVPTGSKVVCIPLYGGSRVATAMNASGMIPSCNLRARVTAGVGAQGLAQCRVFVAYIRDDGGW